MDGIVLAAGLGTRLRPLTDELAKPAVPFMDHPLVGIALEALRLAGVERVAMNSHHLADTLRSAVVAEGASLAVRILHETELLGTGGGVRRLGRSLEGEGPVFVVNSDIVFRPDLRAALHTHRAHGAFATMVVRADPDTEAHGAIERDDGGRIRRIIGMGEAGPLLPRMFTGVHVLSREALADLPERGCIVRDGYLRWLARGEILAAHDDASHWRDLGTPERYLSAHVEVLRGEVPWPAPLVNGSWIHPRSRVARQARLELVAIGDGAQVCEGADLSCVVVWPGAVARGTLRDAVVTPNRVVYVR